jgi:hypothetical protein
MLEGWTDHELVEELCDIDYGLTDWETDFIDSITDQVDKGRKLSPKQREIAAQILSRLDRIDGDVEYEDDE